MNNELTAPTAIYGQQEAGRSSEVRKKLEKLIGGLNKSTMDIAVLLSETKKQGYFKQWGFDTFKDYVQNIDLKLRKAHYLTRIVDIMEIVGIQREVYEPLGIAKLREISSLDPGAIYVDPESNVQTPMKDFITGLIEKGSDMSLEEIKQHVKTLKGLTGENDLMFINFSVKRSVWEETIKPALELAKANIGSVGKDEEGNATDASDGRALEMIAVEFLNNPTNQPFPEEIRE
jgi:hypothetical protein